MGDALDPSDPRIALIRQSVIDAPVVMKGEYAYFIHPLSDGVPRQSAELLDAAAELISERIDWEDIDIILGIEAMGIPLAAALCLRSGKPLVVGRKRPYGLPGEQAIDQTTGYSKGAIFLNDIGPGDRVLVVDDVVSTGGTLEPVLLALQRAGAFIQDVWIVFEKGEGMARLRSERDWPLRSLVRMRMDGPNVVLLD